MNIIPTNIKITARRKDGFRLPRCVFWLERPGGFVVRERRYFGDIAVSVIS